MPFSRLPGGNFAVQELDYVGSGQEDDYARFRKGAAAVFRYTTNAGDALRGVLDRIQVAAKHGAKAVFIIADGELKVGNYEHPLRNQVLDIPAVYITPEVAAQLGVDPSSFTPSRLPSKKIEMKFEIERGNAVGYNLVGKLRGTKGTRSILIVSNLDGFGKLPDGRIYETAKGSAVAIGLMTDLMDYYQTHRPVYNIIFAMVGSKWTSHEGIRDLIRKINWGTIAYTFDLYALGGKGEFFVTYTDDRQKELALRLSKQAFLNPGDFGNAFSAELSRETARLFLVRDDDTWIDDSLTDRFANVDANNYRKNLEKLKSMIDETIRYDIARTPDYNSVGTAYLDVIRKSVNRMETEYFEIYFENEYSGKLTPDFLRSMDEIYERLLKANYYPSVKQKIKVYYLKDEYDRGRVIDHPGPIRHGGAANGKLLAFSAEGPALGNVAHELNHILIDAKGIGTLENNPLNAFLQEAHGQSYLVYYNGNTYVTDPGELINRHFQHEEAPGFLDEVRHFERFNWDYVFVPGSDRPDHMQTTYRIIGSMFSYLKFNFGENAARRAMYKAYQYRGNSGDEFLALFAEEAGLTGDEFVDSWRTWILSSGREIGDVAKAKSKRDADQLTEFDWAMLAHDPSRPENPDADSADRQATLDAEGNLPLTLSAYTAGKVNIQRAYVRLQSGSLALHIEYSSPLDVQVYLFDPPGGMRYMKQQTLKQGQGRLVFEIPVPVFNTINQEVKIMTLNFDDEAFITFDTSQIDPDLLEKTIGASSGTPDYGDYADFMENQYWSQDMIWAIRRGLISGMEVRNRSTGQTERLLKPYDTLTEAQALTILYRYFRPEQMNRQASSDSSWFAAVPYELAKADGLPTLGFVDDQANANKGITRGKLAELMASLYFERVVPLGEAVAFMYEAGITYGTRKASDPLEAFGAEDILQRAHIVSFLHRYDEYVSRNSRA